MKIVSDILFHLWYIEAEVIIVSQKLVKCKSCGAEIAKTAKTCPQCGAVRHNGAKIACTIIAIVTIVLCVAVACSSANSPATPPATLPASELQNNTSSPTEDEDVVLSMENAQVTYKGCTTADGISGCFYISLAIKNTGDAEALYTLSDVYVDDTTCDTGTGLPVVAAPGKKANGSFIIFTDRNLSDVQKIEFKFNIADNETLHSIEVSDTITVAPND